MAGHKKRTPKTKINIPLTLHSIILFLSIYNEAETDKFLDFSIYTYSCNKYTIREKLTEAFAILSFLYHFRIK
jgi:hypothetical protein